MPVSISGDGAITGLELGDFEDVSGTPTDGQFLAWNSSTGKWEPTTMSVKEKKIAAFTASGTWTVPADVTYAIAHMIGGGGGIGTGTTASNGSDSSVAFSGGTVTSKGGTKSVTGDGGLSNAQAGQANSGQGAVAGDSSARGMMNPNSAQWIVAGDTVTPAGSITVTVGAGGSAGTNGAAGGSGYVYIEYYE